MFMRKFLRFDRTAVKHLDGLTSHDSVEADLQNLSWLLYILVPAAKLGRTGHDRKKGWWRLQKSAGTFQFISILCLIAIFAVVKIKRHLNFIYSHVCRKIKKKKRKKEWLILRKLCGAACQMLYFSPAALFYDKLPVPLYWRLWLNTYVPAEYND